MGQFCARLCGHTSSLDNSIISTNNSNVGGSAPPATSSVQQAASDEITPLSPSSSTDEDVDDEAAIAKFDQRVAAEEAEVRRKRRQTICGLQAFGLQLAAGSGFDSEGRLIGGQEGFAGVGASSARTQTLERTPLMTIAEEEQAGEDGSC